MDRQPKPLTSGIAQDLILELFAGQTVHRDEIRERVVEEHLARGGEKLINLRKDDGDPTDLPKRVDDALSDLSYSKRIESQGQCYWKVLSNSETNKECSEHRQSPKKTIGSGSGSVYLYYYPNYRRFAESQGETTWACKIGRTEGDPAIRIKEQTTGMPEVAEWALEIRTDKSKLLENIIQSILDYLGTKKPDAPGTEWFITSPSEVEHIYQRIFEDCQ